MGNQESSSAVISNAERDQRIREDVRALAVQHKDSRSLTLEVCRLLFYRYEETPNANRIYNLTRKGSLTTITDQVAAFWQGLRAQTHVQIPCPGLAEDAADKLGSFLSGLIKEIEQRLNAQLDMHRHAAQDEVRAANLVAEQAKAALKASQDQAAQVKQELEAQVDAITEHVTSLQKDLAGERAMNAHLQDEVELWTERTGAAQSQLRQAQEMFANEVGSLRQMLAATEARASGAEQRALERIEEERTHQRKLTERLGRAEHALTSQTQKTEDLARKVIELTSESSELKGRLIALEEERARLLAENLRLSELIRMTPTDPKGRLRQRPTPNASRGKDGGA